MNEVLLKRLGVFSMILKAK